MDCNCSLLDLRGVVVPDPSDSAERGQYGSVATNTQVRNMKIT